LLLQIQTLEFDVLLIKSSKIQSQLKASFPKITCPSRNFLFFLQKMMASSIHFKGKVSNALHVLSME